MSAASEFPPEVFIPAAARPRSLRLATPLPVPAAPAAAALGAEVVDLDRWRHHLSASVAGGLRGDAAVVPVGSTAAPLRLTRRGVVTLALLSLLGGLSVAAVAWLSAPSAGAADSPAPTVVTVESGDSLWSIAQQVAPSRDPRAEVDHLRSLNHLGDAALVPGQTLRTR